MTLSSRGGIAALIVLGAFSAIGAAAERDPRIAQVEAGLLPLAAEKLGVTATLAERMKAYGVSGLSVAVIDNGKIAWAKGYGVADSRSGRPVTANSLFQAASISKPISALGALLLVQKGKLHLDEDVNLQLKSWKVPDSNLTRDQPVTPRMLMNHASGLSDCVPDNEPGDGRPTLLQLLKKVCVVSPPGKRVEYSAEGYEVLQQLTVDVSGEAFAEYMRKAVLAPLGMKHSVFADTSFPAKWVRKVAVGHGADGQVVPEPLELGPSLAVAGLWTTPTDIAQYVIAVQKTFKGSTSMVLKPPLVQEMLRPGLGGRGLGPTLSGSGPSMRFGHDGGQGAYLATFLGFLDEGRGAVVMVNSGHDFMLILEVIDSIRRAYGWPELGETVQRPPAASLGQQLVVPVSSSNLLKVRTRFKLNDRYELEIYPRGRELFIEGPGFVTSQVFEVPDGRLFCPQMTFSDLGSPWLQLVFDSSGKVSKLRADDDGSVVLDAVVE
ncbi:MAG: serine hydrolase domain-containing protein [Pseudomonadota bacterium]